MGAKKRILDPDIQNEEKKRKQLFDNGCSWWSSNGSNVKEYGKNQVYTKRKKKYK